MDKIRIGILGYGFMGSTHGEMLKGIEEASVVAIADPLPEAREKAKKDFPDAKIYSDSLELLKNPEVDAVIIATPPNTHIPLLVEAIKQEKHVLVEKPLAEKLESLKPLLEVNIPENLVIMSGFSLRYHPMYVDLEQHMKSLGEVYLFHHTALGSLPPAKWILDENISGGLLNENAVHILYLFLWYFGFPEKIYASIKDLTTKGINDNVLYIAHHKDITTASLLRSWSAKQVVRYFEVTGTKGSIHIDGYLGGMFTIVINGEKKTFEYSDGIKEMYTTELKEFIDSILKNRKPLTGLREAIQVQIMVHAAKQSNLKQAVVDPVKEAGILGSKLLEKYQ